jgi:hypothetical protein
MNKLFFPALLLCLLVISCNTASTKKGSHTHDQIMDKASRTEKNGWIFVHLQGPPEVIGYQNGFLLANEILDLRGALGTLYGKTTGKNWDFYRNQQDYSGEKSLKNIRKN